MIVQTPSQLQPGASIGPEEELARVMSEVTAALHGRRAVLTLHPARYPARVMYAEAESGTEELVAALIAAGTLDWKQAHADDHIWVSGAFVPYAPHAIAIPVRQVPGHSRLVITVFFDTLDAERKAAAEAAYLQRRPFAVGYFRLWQQDRLDRHDIDTLRAALDRVGIAIMMVTKGGELGFTNKAAGKLLKESEGIFARDGRLRARHRSDGIALQASIDQVIDHSDNPALLRQIPLVTARRSGLPPLILSVLPSPHPVMEEGEIAAMILAVDPSMDIAELAIPVCRMFGLTRVETELACHLASGRTLQESAELMRVKDETARSYLKMIFTKTGVNRQADLVRTILVSLVRASDGREYLPANRTSS